MNSNNQPLEIGRTNTIFSVAVALLFIIFAMVMGYIYIGLPPVVIVGGSGVIGFV
ncbi:MAG: hypothetical protein H0U50_08405, partial [Pyrinomonadaceae bacterium]|nr:hypothetical protein [Pyrinomonadaceae bacterium]